MIKIVTGAYSKNVVFSDRISDIDTERKISTFMMKQEYIVKLDIACLIDSPEIQKQFFIFPLKTIGQRKRSGVFKSVQIAFVSRKIGLGRKGDLDVISVEFPGSAKREKRISFQ